MVVVDRLSKYANFGPLPSSHSAIQVVDLFTTMVIILHGVHRSIISDRGTIFTSKFWRKLFELMGTNLRMSSAYHPQLDGQYKVLNRCLEQYLRAFVSDSPTSWVQFLPWAEYHYNTSYHSAIGMTLFQAEYGRTAHTLPAYTRGADNLPTLAEDLTTEMLCCSVYEIT